MSCFSECSFTKLNVVNDRHPICLAWELHESRELRMCSALAHVNCRAHRSCWRQLSTTVLLVTFIESPPSLGRCDRVHASSSFVTSARYIKGQK